MEETLPYFVRGTEKLYCFIEVCQAVFPNTPKSTVRNWLKTLNIATTVCSAEERTFFRTKNQALGGTFGLIRHDDLSRLIDYRKGKRPRCEGPASESVCSSSAATIPSSSNSTATDVGRNAISIVGYDYSSDSDEVEAVPEIPNLNSSVCEIKPKTDSPSNSKPKRKRHQILMEDAPENLRKEIEDLRHFYTRYLNPSRKGGPLAESTLAKITERVMYFMFYCKNVKNLVEISILLFNNIDLYTSYVEYLRDVRKLKPSTISAHISVSINVVKYNLAVNEPLKHPDSSRQLQAYRAFERQFDRESYVLAKRAKEGLLTKTSQQFYFAHILDTLRSVREKYYESRGLKKLRYLHDFVLLATYLRAIPGRSQEIRTMRLYVESQQNEPFGYTALESGNFIVFEQDGRVVIVQFDFKTAKHTGPTKIDLSTDTDLVYFLRLYLDGRTSLLLGKSHDFFFCNTQGDPFLTSNAIANYLGNIFEREVSIRASTTAIRHAIVTYFSSLDEAEDSGIRKSLALLMKHSVRYQQTVYNDQTHSEKTSKARDLMREKMTAGVFGEFSQSNAAQTISSDDESGDESEIRPGVGDIVALLDPVSTKKNIAFFLGKIARYTADRKEVHLIHLEQVQDSENVYRLKPGKIWTEPTRALVFPIDIVYNVSIKAYELRTSSLDIFNVVHGIV